MAESTKRYFLFAILFVCLLAPKFTPQVACQREDQLDDEQGECDVDEEEEEEEEQEEPLVDDDETDTIEFYRSERDPPRFSCSQRTHGEPCSYQAMCGVVSGVSYKRQARKRPQRRQRPQRPQRRQRPQRPQQRPRRPDRRRRRGGYINGGTVVKDGEFPFVAQLDTGTGFCSGVIVSGQHVYTAAHCVLDEKGKPKPASQMRVHVGSVKHFDSPDDDRITYRVSKVCVSPRAKLQSTVNQHEYDVAVLRLMNRLQFDARVQPACWPYMERGSVNMGRNSECYVMGVGYEGYPNNTGSVGMPAEQVRKSRVMTTSCEHDAHRSNFCVVDTPGKPTYEQGSICQGDSGGPMLCLDNYKRWVVVGLNGYSRSHCIVGSKSGIRKINDGMTEVLLSSTSCAVGADDDADDPPTDNVDCEEDTDGLMCRHHLTCGTQRIGGYIINGQQITNNEAPFLVRVINSESDTECLGALVDQAHVVTSKECLKTDFRWTAFSKIKIQAGSEGQEYRVINRCEAKRQGSLAMITAGNLIHLNHEVQPVCWPYTFRRLPEVKYQKNCVIYGLGATNQEATILAKKVTKMVVNEVVCSTTEDEPGHMCFRPTNPRSSACLDNGAPVVCRDLDQKWTLVAMVEDSSPACTPGSLIKASAINRFRDHNLAMCRD